MSSLLKDTLSEEDLKELIEEARNGRARDIFYALEAIKDFHFEENDILVHMSCENGWGTKDKDKNWEVEAFSKANVAPRKYRVVHTDEVGLPYVQKVSMKGELCGDVKCMASYDSDYHKFEHDPDFVDHQILADEGDVFDPQEVYKEKRDEYFQLKPKAKRKTKQVDSSVEG